MMFEYVCVCVSCAYSSNCAQLIKLDVLMYSGSSRARVITDKIVSLAIGKLAVEDPGSPFLAVRFLTQPSGLEADQLLVGLADAKDVILTSDQDLLVPGRRASILLVNAQHGDRLVRFNSVEEDVEELRTAAGLAATRSEQLRQLYDEAKRRCIDAIKALHDADKVPVAVLE